MQPIAATKWPSKMYTNAFAVLRTAIVSPPIKNTPLKNGQGNYASLTLVIYSGPLGPLEASHLFSFHSI
jgi:hypothetical protein